jgi:hypothetical protein
VLVEVETIFFLKKPIKGWHVEEASTLADVSSMIFGSPNWDIPQDIYKIIDTNETYSLIAVFSQNKISYKNRYLALNSDIIKNYDKTIDSLEKK